MATFYPVETRHWAEMYSGVLVSDFHRYETGGGAALFRMAKGSVIPEHDHPTGEHGYVVSGSGLFGGKVLRSGDAFWVGPGETHEVEALEELCFFATSLPRR